MKAGAPATAGVAEVGRSWRTYAKHEIMNAIIGKEAGVCRVSHDVCCLDWIDLTAGDAAQIDGEEWHRTSSPGLLAYHASEFAKRSQKPINIYLHEIQDATFDRLLRNLDLQLPALGFTRRDNTVWMNSHVSAYATVAIIARNWSGQDADIRGLVEGGAVLVLNDPNAITEWAMRPNFMADIYERGIWRARSLSVMGCNPSGIKRLPPDERRGWFHHLRTQEKGLPGYHDLLLAAIEKDDAQWAYLLQTPRKWQNESERVMARAFASLTPARTVALSTFRSNRENYECAKANLFTTKREREEGYWDGLL